MNLIFASDPFGLIGRDGAIPWKQKADLRRFKKLTSDSEPGKLPLVVMGRKTFDSLGRKSLPGRNSLVISSTLPDAYRNEGVIVKPREVAIPFLESGGFEIPVWVIGGAETYNLLLHLVDRIFWTKIHRTFDFTNGDTSWCLPFHRFKCVEQSEVYPADEDNQYPYQFLEYRRMEA